MLTVLLDLAALRTLGLGWVYKRDKLSGNLSLIVLVLNAADIVLGLGLVSSGDMLLTVLSGLVLNAALCTLGLGWVYNLDKLSGNLSLTVLVLNTADSVLDLRLVSSGDLLLIVLRDKVLNVSAYARALGLGWISKLSSLLTIILFSSSTNFFFAE